MEEFSGLRRGMEMPIRICFHILIPLLGWETHQGSPQYCACSIVSVHLRRLIGPLAAA